MEDNFKIKEENMDAENDGRPPFNFPIRINPADHTGFNEFTFKLLRPVSCHTGLLTNPHGSVKLSQGDTCVLAAVFGPTEVRLSKELPHRGAVDVLFRPKVTGMSQASLPVMDPVIGERNTENILISIFESSIYLEEIAGLGHNIILHELEDDGCLLSSCINATTIALLDGGCSLRHTVAGVSLILTRDNKLVVDPSSTQLKQGYDMKFTYAFSSEMEILYANIQGHGSPQTLKIVQDQARLAAAEMFGFFHFLILKKNQKVMEEQQQLNRANHVLPHPIKKEKPDPAPEDGELMSDSDS